MKLSWKLFFVTCLISLMVFSIGGFLFNLNLFQRSYQREQSLAQTEHSLLEYAILTTSQTLYLGQPIKTEELLAQIGTSVAKNTETNFRLYNQAKNSVFPTEHPSLSQPKIQKQQKISQLYRNQGKMYLVIVSALSLADNQIYLETTNDLSHLFSERDKQLATFQQLMLAMLLINGLLIWLSANWLTTPIQKLGLATQTFRQGKLNQRFELTSDDEIGQLGKDFNEMADNIEESMIVLQLASQRQEEFIASFAHEIRTPLTAVIGYAEMLQLKQLTEEQQQVASHYIIQEGRRIERLADKLLKLILLEQQDFQKETLKMTEFEKELRVIVAGHQPHFFTVELSLEPTVLRVEPDLFKMLFINLIDNGIKALPSQGGQILIRGSNQGDDYQFEIIDNGKGMSEETLAKIKEPFFMADWSRQAKGAGLGLAICEKIINFHQGKWQFISQENQGTTVILRFPKEVGDEKAL